MIYGILDAFTHLRNKFLSIEFYYMFLPLVDGSDKAYFSRQIRLLKRIPMSIFTDGKHIEKAKKIKAPKETDLMISRSNHAMISHVSII